MPKQEHDVPRETFIALRARREAYGIASDILYEETINVRSVACSGCGGWIEVTGKTITDPLTCPSCKARTPLPPYLRARYLPRRPRQSQGNLSYVAWASEPGDVDDEPLLTLPRWLIWFSVVLAALLVGAAAALIAR